MHLLKQISCLNLKANQKKLTLFFKYQSRVHHLQVVWPLMLLLSLLMIWFSENVLDEKVL